MTKLKILATLILPILTTVSIYFIFIMPRVNIPSHMLNNPVVDKQNFFSKSDINELLKLTRQLRTIPASTRDVDFTKPIREHIGEATPIIKEGSTFKCSDPFLIPNRNKTECIFPGRIDIGKHFIRSGGSQGRKEKYETSVSRLQSFLYYIFNYTEYDVPKRLLNSEEFVSLAKSVCPSQDNVLDPFQFNIVAQLPGQTIASHIDGVYFWGANRFNFPQWLLAAMAFSGLFKEKFVHQVQVVGYFHNWTDLNNTRQGNFIYWNEPLTGPSKGKAQIVPPHSGSANAIDGTKTIHSAEVYMPDRIPPRISITSQNEIRYLGSEKWGLFSDGQLMETYPENEIRFSVVYRARCFKNDEEKQKYHKIHEKMDGEDMMTLEYIMEIFKTDLFENKKVLSSRELFDKLSAYDKGVLIMDTYIQYPYSETAWIPFNYCALSKKFPMLKFVLDYICA